MIRSMSERRWLKQQSYSVLVVVLLLVTASGLTLLHWHKDWNERGCQLCHVRNLPTALSPAAEGLTVPTPVERDWRPDNPVSEIETCFVDLSSRAPPSPITFTV